MPRRKSASRASRWRACAREARSRVRRTKGRSALIGAGKNFRARRALSGTCTLFRPCLAANGDDRWPGMSSNFLFCLNKSTPPPAAWVTQNPFPRRGRYVVMMLIPPGRSGITGAARAPAGRDQNEYCSAKLPKHGGDDNVRKKTTGAVACSRLDQPPRVRQAHDGPGFCRIGAGGHACFDACPWRSEEGRPLQARGRRRLHHRFAGSRLMGRHLHANRWRCELQLPHRGRQHRRGRSGARREL